MTKERKNKILTLSLLWGGLVLLFLVIFFIFRGMSQGNNTDIPDYYYKTAYTGQLEKVKDTSKLTLTNEIAGKGATIKLVDKVNVNVDGSNVKQYADILAVDSSGKLYMDIRKAAEATKIELTPKTSTDNNFSYVLEIKDYTLKLSDNQTKIPITFGNYLYGTDRVKSPIPTVVLQNAAFVPFDVVRQFLALRVGYDEKSNTLYMVSPKKSKEVATELVKQKEYTLFIEQGSSLAFDRYIVNKGGAFLGVVDFKLKKVIDIQYSSINLTSDSDFTLQLPNEKRGTLDINGKPIVEVKYDYFYKIDPNNDLYIVSLDGKYGLQKSGGEGILKLEYDDIGGNSTNYDGEQALVRTLIFEKYFTVLKDKKYAIYDITGKEIIPFEFSGIGYSMEFDYKKELTLIVNHNGKECLIAKKGELYGAVTVPQNDVVIPFEYTAIYQDVKNNNVLTGIKDGKTVLIK